MRKSTFLVGLILVIWFVISFVTNILGPLVPDIIKAYNLSLTMAAFLPFSFFLAYGVMSIPAGVMIEKLGEKISMLIAFGMTFIGSSLFAFFPIYSVALISLFVIGLGMAMLQVIINPLMREAGGEENFAFYSVMGQLVFGAASFVSPHVYTYLVSELTSYSGGGNILIDSLSKVIPAGLPWISLYWMFAVVLLAMVIIIKFVKLPQVELKDDEKSGAVDTYIHLIKNKKVILFFIGIMCYVGTEQGIANWMSQFMSQYHGLDPQTVGASAIAWFWGLMSAGCLLGLILLKLMDSKLVLKIFTVISMITLAIALFGTADMSFYAFPAVGFFISVMFSVIFSLALNSVPNHHGSFSGILCSGILGGALVPLIVGAIGDVVGLKIAMMFMFLTLGYILCIGFWAKPLVNNKTVSLRELLSK